MQLHSDAFSPFGTKQSDEEIPLAVSTASQCLSTMDLDTSNGDEAPSLAPIDMKDGLADPIGASELGQLLIDGSETTGIQSTTLVVLIDCRPFLAFCASHIVTAHNVCYPPILERRRRQRRQDFPGSATTVSSWDTQIPLENIVRCEDIRHAMVEGLCETVVVYDDDCCSVGNPEGRTTASEDGRKDGTQLVSVLMSLRNALPVQRIHWLQGLNLVCLSQFRYSEGSYSFQP
jgi:hypothetical protein